MHLIGIAILLKNLLLNCSAQWSTTNYLRQVPGKGTGYPLFNPKYAVALKTMAMTNEINTLFNPPRVLGTDFSSAVIKEMLLAYWQKQHQLLPPRSLLLVVNIKESNQVLAYGTELLGLESGQLYPVQRLLEICHPGHQRVLMYYIKSMHELWNTSIQRSLWSGKGEFFLSVFTAARESMPCESEQYAMIYLTAEAFIQGQDQANDLVFLWGHLLGTHRGEPVEVNLVRQSPLVTPESGEIIEQWLKAVRREVFLRLRFTKVQRLVIKAMVQQQKNVPQIAHDHQVSIRTIEGHCRNILTHARRVFKQPEFRNTYEVIDYLKQQCFLD